MAWRAAARDRTAPPLATPHARGGEQETGADRDGHWTAVTKGGVVGYSGEGVTSGWEPDSRFDAKLTHCPCDCLNSISWKRRSLHTWRSVGPCSYPTACAVLFYGRLNRPRTSLVFQNQGREREVQVGKLSID